MHLLQRFFLIVCLLGVMLAPRAYASEAFINSEVSVDVTGKDMVSARAQAMAKGEFDALSALVNKFATPGREEAIMASLDTKSIPALSKGTQVLEEKMSGTRYRARLLVTFNAEDITSLVSKFGSSDEKEEIGAVVTRAYLIIPSYEEDASVQLWEDKNPWRATWKSIALEVTSGDIIVPYGDNSDMSIIDTKGLATATYASLAPLTLRYGVSDIIILQARLVQNPDLALNVVKRRMNRARNEVNMLTYRADPQETRDLLLARAARDIIDGLQNKKEEEQANVKGVRIGERNKVMVLASVTTLGSWTATRAKLSELPMIDRIELLAMSAQQVDMILHYRGTPDSLAIGIQGKGLRLMQNKEYWTISRD